jgi:peptidylprolyl isomerase
MLSIRTVAVATSLAAAALLAGCSSSTGTASGTTQATTAPTTTAPITIDTIPVGERSPAGMQGSAPTDVVVPTGAAPAHLEVATLIPGHGPAVVDGDKVTVEYTLATYSSGKVIQSSWTDGAGPFVVNSVGAGDVIPGWDAGLVGMRVGERREFIIPASLGYGATSPGAGIAANDTLVFIVDLIKIN